MKEIIRQHHLTNIDLLKETVEQIQKDFEEAGINITFSGDKETAYVELCDQIEPILLQLMQEDQNKLLNILYRIDVPEKKFSETIHKENGSISAVVELIVKRELQKVVLRHHFSNKKS